MIKKILLLLFCLLVLPANAGIYENALKHNDTVAVYFYAPMCPTCIDFNYYWQEITKKHKSNYKTIKINVRSSYGKNLFYLLEQRHVPSVVLVDKKNFKIQNIESACLFNYKCLDSAFEEFIK